MDWDTAAGVDESGALVDTAVAAAAALVVVAAAALAAVASAAYWENHQTFSEEKS